MSESLKESQRLFGTDGIRARYGDEPLTEPSIRRIGAAIGRVLAAARYDSRATPPMRVLVGRDTRASGAAILRALTSGLASQSVSVADLGVIPTPGVAYCVKNLGAAAGIVISASHNPGEDNGIKVFGPDGFKLADELEDAIEVAFVKEPPCADSGARPADASAHVAAYREHLIAAGGTSKKPLAGKKLAVDCANGACAALAPLVFRELGADVIEIACKPDGKNINEGCGALHPESLSAAVAANKADAGVTFDGDGDRLMLLDESGKVLDGDYMLAILARKLKAEGGLRGGLVVSTVMANLGLELSLSEIGVKLARAPVGDRYVVAQMLSDDAALGGEQSGHIIHLTRGSTTGDGVFNAVQLLTHIFSGGKRVSGHCGVLKKYPQILINLKVRSKPKLEGLASVAAALANAEKELGKNGRVVLRYSGTEPKARVMVEGPDEASIKRHAQSIADAIKAEIGA